MNNLTKGVRIMRGVKRWTKTKEIESINDFRRDNGRGHDLIKMRLCMGCGNQFLSADNGNRHCEESGCRSHIMQAANEEVIERGASVATGRPSYIFQA